MNKTSLWCWYPDLYVGELIGREKNKRLKALMKKRGRKQSKPKKMLSLFQEFSRNISGEELTEEITGKEEETYVITVSQNPNDMLDIYPEHSILQEYFMNRPMYILGIGKGYKDAVMAAGEIVSDYLNREEDAKASSLKDYFFDSADC